MRELWLAAYLLTPGHCVFIVSVLGWAEWAHT
jgi:hypothetical protein